MDHDMHDDGLVHGHAWATEPPPSIGMMLRPANDDGRGVEPSEIAAAMNSHHEDGHDDGLVHGHGWARFANG